MKVNLLIITKKPYLGFLKYKELPFKDLTQNIQQKMTQADQKSRLTKQNTQPNEPQIIEERSNKTNNTVIRRYKKGQFLGKGGFARCYEVQNLQNRKISAIKIVCKQTLKKAKAKQKLITQIKIHKSLSHKNVVSFDHVFQDSQNVYIVLELCSNHTLNEMLKKRKNISQLQVQYFIVQIIEGLKYLHNDKVIHRDLKLGNLMINEQLEVKIGDFGLAAKLEFNSEKRKTICGTPNYLAPQIIQGKGHSYEVDIWSLGVIMYALLYGRPPFETNDVKKTYKRIKQCQYTFNDEINVSHNAKNLISRIMIVDPSKRLTLDQILCHPFINSNKIPKSLPGTCLSSPLPKSYIEQYTYYGGSLGASKLHNSMKALEKVENEYEKNKLQKGISERLLLRSSAGMSRNLLTKAKQDTQANYIQRPVLSNNFFNNKPQTSKAKERLQISKSNQSFVKKWVDYSSKYGLGYLLSDGSTGIYFNDSTKMCLDNCGQKVDYVTNEIEDEKVLITLNVSDGTSDRQISKKITLMQYFRKYLNGGSSTEEENLSDINGQKKVPFVYIKKWTKTEEGIIFRLNTKLIQVNFNDKTQLMIYGESGLIVYCGKNNQKYMVSLQNYQQQIKKYHEFCIKMEQTKAMIKKMTQKDHSAQKTQNGFVQDFQNKEIAKAY